MTRLGLTLGFLACNGGDPSLTDTPPSDTQPTTWPRGEVSLTLRDRDYLPMANIPVAWHDPTGALEGWDTTDGDGQVGATVAEGGMATVFLVDEGESLTIVGLEPGDALSLGPARPRDDDGKYVGIAIPMTTLPKGAETAVASNGCSTNHRVEKADVVSLRVGPECIGTDGTVSVVAWAKEPIEGARDEDLVAATALHGLVPSTSTPPTGAFPPWTTSMDATDVALLALDDAAEREFQIRGHAHRNGVRYVTPFPEDVSLTADDDRVMLSFGPTGFTEVFEVTARYRSNDPGTPGRETMWGQQATTPFPTLTVGPDQIGPLSDAEWDGSERRIAFDHPPTALAGMSAVYGTIQWGTGDDTRSWSFLAPPGTLRVAVPEVPDEHIPLVPPQGAMPQAFSSHAGTFSATHIDWQAFRTHFAGLGVVPSSGRDALEVDVPHTYVSTVDYEL